MYLTKRPLIGAFQIVPIGCVPLSDLAVPPALSATGDKAPDSPSNHFMYIVPPVLPESPPAPDTDALSALQVIDVRPKAPRAPSTVV